MYNKRKIILKEKNAVLISNPLSKISDSYRRIKVNIEAKNNDYKTFMITSAIKGEGKSLTVINLAKAYAEDKSKKVLVMDLNLRNPNLHEYYGCNNEKGVSSFLESTDENLNIYKNKEYGFDLVCAGKETNYPTALLGSEKFSKEIEELKKQYNIILIDTPSVKECPDAMVVAKYCDACLFVVSKIVSNKKDTRQALRELQNNNVNVIGSIYNDVK